MSSVKKKKINDFKVKAVNLSDVKEVYNLPVKGSKLGLGLLHNTFIVAPKNSGKSHLIYRILKATTTPETKIVIICPTHDKDALYKKLIKDFTNKGYDISSYYEIDDILPQILEEDELEDDISSSDSDEEVEPPSVYFSPDMNDDFQEYEFVDSKPEEKMKSKRKKKKKKYQVPKRIIIFDDLSQGCRNPSLDLWLKRHRHYNTSNIISVQYYHDCLPSSYRQADNFIAFPKLSKKKIKELHHLSDSNLTLSKFSDLYYDATSKKYNFFNISLRNNTYKKNFDELYLL
jgi:hypothetical protein